MFCPFVLQDKWGFVVMLASSLVVNLMTNSYVPCVHAKLLQLCPTLHNPVDCSLTGSSVHRILQARILECITMPSSRGSSWPQRLNLHLLCLLHWRTGSLPLAPPRKPLCTIATTWIRVNKFNWFKNYYNLEGWDGLGDGRGHLTNYGWFMLMCDRNPYNIVKQLSFD